MTVSSLVLILLSMGCGIALGMIGLATCQAMRDRDAASQTSEGLDE